MNSEETSLTIRQIMGKAVAAQARRFTYCLVYEETGETKVGTSVAVKLGEHFFLATAGHVIENAQSVKALMHDQVTHYVSDFAKRYYDSYLDVGLLEISLPDSQRFDFLSQHRLCETIEEEQEIPAMVVGFPGQFCNTMKQIDLTPESSLRLVRCDTLTFNTVVIPLSEWPSEGLPDEHANYKPLIAGRDILIDYEPEPQVKPFTPQTTGADNPPVECPSLDPCGMSGGGIWLAQINEGKVRVKYPNPRLIGLQLGWHRTRNLLRGMRINIWLDFIRKHYPELRQIV